MSKKPTPSPESVVATTAISTAAGAGTGAFWQALLTGIPNSNPPISPLPLTGGAAGAGIGLALSTQHSSFLTGAFSVVSGIMGGIVGILAGNEIAKAIPGAVDTASEVLIEMLSAGTGAFAGTRITQWIGNGIDKILSPASKETKRML